MSAYENLLYKWEDFDLKIKETSLNYSFKGLYKNGKILIEKSLTNTEKYCVLAEEIGHYVTSFGDIINQSEINNIKKERTARKWAYQNIVPLSKLIEARLNNCQR